MIAAEQKNRIQIVNWRRHGDDESYVRMEVFRADEDVDLTDVIENDEGVDREAEDRGEYDKVYYVNNDFTIEDGQILTGGTNGRKFRVTITEVE